VIVRCKQSPNRAGIPFDRETTPCKAKRVEADTLAKEHSQDVVIGPNEHFDRVLERIIKREPGRVHVAVWTDDGKMLHGLEKPDGHRPRLRVRGEETQSIERQHFSHDSVPFVDLLVACS
jgi:hypothetical protein